MSQVSLFSSDEFFGLVNIMVLTILIWKEGSFLLILMLKLGRKAHFYKAAWFLVLPCFIAGVVCKFIALVGIEAVFFSFLFALGGTEFDLTMGRFIVYFLPINLLIFVILAIVMGIGTIDGELERETDDEIRGIFVLLRQAKRILYRF